VPFLSSPAPLVHPPLKSPFLSRLPRELIRHKKPPQALTAFLDSMSPNCARLTRPDEHVVNSSACFSGDLLK
jgi:hypothetical protein